MAPTTSHKVYTEYFYWLYSQVGSLTDKNPNHTYWLLLDRLHDTAFVPFVPNDQNRADDGVYLRGDFERLTGISSESLTGPCSMFEMILALAMRISFTLADGENEEEGYTGKWFWEMLENINLAVYTDEVYSQNIEGNHRRVDRILERVNDRAYTRTGKGGLFPLKVADNDQRDIELWYQMSSYLMQRNAKLGVN